MAGPPHRTDNRRALLPPCELSSDERDAAADRPRPGAWFGDDIADGRPFDLDRTEVLIRAELVARAPEHEREELIRRIGKPQTVMVGLGDDEETYLATADQQRGGIASDPLVRVLALRCWGHRDRRWPDVLGMTDDELADHLRQQLGFARLQIERNRGDATTTLMAQHAHYFAAIRLRDCAAPERQVVLSGACGTLKNLVTHAPSVPARVELERPDAIDRALWASRDPARRDRVERALIEQLLGEALDRLGVDTAAYVERLRD